MGKGSRQIPTAPRILETIGLRSNDTGFKGVISMPSLDERANGFGEAELTNLRRQNDDP